MQGILICNTLRQMSKASAEKQQLFIKSLKTKPFTSDQLLQYVQATIIVMDQSPFKEKVESIIEIRLHQCYDREIQQDRANRYKVKKDNKNMLAKREQSDCRSSPAKTSNPSIIQQLTKLLFSSKSQNEAANTYKNEKEHKEKGMQISLKYNQDQQTMNLTSIVNEENLIGHRSHVKSE